MDIKELVDNERWLMNNGLISDSAKNNIYMYAYLVNKDVKAAEVDIVLESKRVEYTLYLDNKVFDAYEFYSTRTDSWWSLIKSAYYIRKHGNLNFNYLLSRFVKDYAGPSWSISLKVKRSKDYK